MSRMIYLAAHYARNAEMRGYRDILEAMGHKVTSRWIDQHQDTGLLTEALGEAELNAHPELGTPYALKDMEDIYTADTVMSFTNGRGRGGRHVEFGMAVVLMKRLVIVGPREHVFHTLPDIEHYPDWSRLFLKWSGQR
jgi:hypothetical protein